MGWVSFDAPIGVPATFDSDDACIDAALRKLRRELDYLASSPHMNHPDDLLAFRGQVAYIDDLIARRSEGLGTAETPTL